MRKYIKEAKEKGAIPIVCSLVPRNDWDKNEKVKLSTDSYAGWSEEVAKVNAEVVAKEIRQLDKCNLKGFLK